MKKKLLATAVTAAAATLSAGAFAGIDISAGDGNVPRVASGTTVVLETIVIEQTAGAPTLNDGDTVVVALPTGMSFSGTPTATATGVALESNALGFPGSKGLVTPIDTNNDGSDDSMSVVVANTAVDGATITIAGEVTYTGTSKAGTDLKVTVFVDDEEDGVEALDTSNVIAKVVSALATPISQINLSSAITVPNDTAAGVAINSDFILTVPEGVEETEEVVLTLGSELELGAALTVVALTDDAPTVTITGNAAGSNKVTLTFDGDVDQDSQYLIEISSLDVTAQDDPETATLTVSGDAGSGTANLAVLAEQNTTADLADDDESAADFELVIGSSAPQALPEITITENFGGSLGTGTITLTPGAGLAFDDAAAVTVDDAEGQITATVTSVEDDEIVITVTGNTGTFATGADTLTISGIEAVATKSASGVLSIQVGDDDVDGEADNVPSTVLNVATAIARGDVEVEGPETPATVGSDATGLTGIITITEETYGAIGAPTGAYIRITPPEDVEITDVTTSVEDGDVDIGTAEETTPSDGSWVIFINEESSEASEVDITVEFDVEDQAVGTDIVFTLDGTAGVSGEATLATVAQTSKTTVGAIPSVEPGSANSQSLASITITESFADALDDGATDGQFRVIAPPGVTFTGTTTGTSSVETTFNANDTLVIAFQPTGGVDTITRTPRAIISGNVADDTLLAFTIADADDSDNRIGLVGGTVNLAYTGDIETLEAGAAAAINVGFNATNEIAGGLAPFSVASSDEDVATASVDGEVVTVSGLAAGTTTITVTDALGSEDTYLVTVSAGAGEQSEYDADTIATTDGSTSTASFSAGATTDGGDSYDTEFTTGDDVTIVGTITPDEDDVGEAGGLFIVVRTQVFDDAGEVVSSNWFYKDVDGNFQPWDTMVASLQPAVEVDALEEAHFVQVFEGELTAATHKVFLGYMVDGGPLVYTSVPMELTVTEE